MFHLAACEYIHVRVLFWKLFLFFAEICNYTLYRVEIVTLYLILCSFAFSFMFEQPYTWFYVHLNLVFMFEQRSTWFYVYLNLVLCLNNLKLDFMFICI